MKLAYIVFKIARIISLTYGAVPNIYTLAKLSETSDMKSTAF